MTYGWVRRPAPEVDQAYQHFNQAAFGGRLPRFDVFYVRHLGDPRCGPEWGWVDFNTIAILLDALLGQPLPHVVEFRTRVLLHEMAHVAVGPRANGAHGPEWKRQMRRLVRQGFDPIPDDRDEDP